MTDYTKHRPSSSVNPFKEDPAVGAPPNHAPPPDPRVLDFVQQLPADLQQGDFDLPPFPETAAKIQACISDPNSDNQALAAIVATEPALAARLMRMANSAMMRRGPMEVTDIATAISRVGTAMVQNAAASFAAREAFKAPPGSPCVSDLNKLRQVSIAVASISYVLAGHIRSAGKPEEAMLAGLLNSVGKFYIFMRASDHAALFTERSVLDGLILSWHAGVARAIVESWEFPESIALAVDEQELRVRDRSAPADIGDLLFVGNLLARAGLGAAAHLGDLDALARMRMDAAQLADILADREDEIQSMISAMS